MYTAGGMPHHGGSREWWSAVRGLNNNSSSSNNNNNNVMVVGGDPLERVAKVASENAVVIVSESSCCMCHAVKQLFCGMGVNPTVYELDHDPRGKDIERALTALLGRRSPVVPVVFVGGKLVGAVDRVMASHINGTLVPLLKQAGALWL